ncbi:F-box/LRR-repeat protein fbxl-1-like isoform X3 [Lineus longissimus]|uniref:F-box/LRR-repeat protein fbxl-1-like isoform X3 n=1 Tax=Lineus longissimus TaxID=88925 RepID=UPI00315D6623
MADASFFTLAQNAAQAQHFTGSSTAEGRKQSMFPGAVGSPNNPRRRSSIPRKGLLGDDHQLESFDPQPAKADPRHISKLPDKILLKIFSYIPHKELCKIATVCKKWRLMAYDSRLWQVVSLRPDFSGLHVSSIEALLALISVRFGHTLRYIELPSELVTPPVVHELANKCPNLKYITLDFSNAMQLHDFNDLNAFPCNLKSMCICLSEVIFMEGFMRRIYSCLSSLQVLHLIGTFELSNDEEEEIYEVINISKIKAHTPNLRVVNLYGISFVDDSHVELLSSNCIHLECLALNFCLRVKGASLKVVLQKCRKLRSLLLQHTSIEDQNMMDIEWEKTVVDELDITSTELSTDCLDNILNRMNGFRYLGVGHCDFFVDKVLEKLMQKELFTNLEAIDIGYTTMLSEVMINRFLRKHGPQLRGFVVNGKSKLTEQFWVTAIPQLKQARTLVLGTADGWFLKLSSKVHIDQIIEEFAKNCPFLERLEIQWDPQTIRYSDKSSKFIDHLRLRCPHLKSLTLSDGEYYEMAKSNFERADRSKVVRTTTNYQTSLVSLLRDYNDLLFN